MLGLFLPFVLKLNVSPPSLVLNSGILDLACGWLGRFVVFPSWGSPSTVPAKFYTPSRNIQDAELGLRLREIPAAELGSQSLPCG